MNASATITLADGLDNVSRDEAVRQLRELRVAMGRLSHRAVEVEAERDSRPKITAQDAAAFRRVNRCGLGPASEDDKKAHYRVVCALGELADRAVLG